MHKCMHEVGAHSRALVPHSLASNKLASATGYVKMSKVQGCKVQRWKRKLLQAKQRSCLRKLTSGEVAFERLTLEEIYSGSCLEEAQEVYFAAGAKVTYEGREMTVSMAPDSNGDMKMIDFSGIMALTACLPECRSLTSLKCAAAAPKCSLSYQRSLTLLSIHPRSRMLAVLPCNNTTLVRKK
jgi:hypothetical protein